MMRISSLRRLPGLMALGLGAAMLMSPAAQAADSAQAQYQADVQRCHSTPGIDKQACLREAGAALEASRRDKLTTPSPQAETSNRNARCDALPAERRQDCLTLMQQGTVTEGSVSGGGVIRETTITVPAPTPTPGTVSPSVITPTPGVTTPAPVTAPRRY